MKRGAFLRQMRSYLGTEEEPRGSNWGPEGGVIRRCLACVKIYKPASWCAALICLGVYEANDNAFPSWFHPSASALGLVANNGGLIIPDKRLIQPEDVVISDHGKGHGHAMAVESVVKVNDVIRFRDISGNSNDECSREGYECCSNIRTLDDPKIVAVLRFPLA